MFNFVSDWTDRAYSNELIHAILRRDYKLNLRYPPQSLNGSLTSKLNYLLYIRDLALLNGLSSDCLFGIDIGTGAALYFAVLAVRHFGWKMLATENNQEDFRLAIQNISTNDLYNDIKLVQPRDENQIFVFEANDSQVYFFTVCNPPFFDPVEEKQRDFRTHEQYYDGGEVEFVSKMIDQSSLVSHKVKIFSTMLGHKKSVSLLKKKIYSVKNIQNSKSFELCQGRTMRWVLVWTYYPEINLDLQTKKTEARILDKQKKPIAFEYENDNEEPMDCFSASLKLKEFLKKIDIDVVKEGSKNSEKSCYLRLKTYYTHWRGLRSKRRALENKPSNSKRMKFDMEENISDDSDIDELPVQLDCQLYLGFDCESNKMTFQFIFLSGEVGKGGMAELVQCIKREL